MARVRAVVVGAGFGGLTAARWLARGPIDVTVVDRHNHHTFSPLLYQVATAGLDAENIAHAVRGIFHDQPNVSVLLDTVTGVDWDRHRLQLAETSVGFDFLVLAAGTSTADFGVPGVREHALVLKTLADAMEVRHQVLRQFEEADKHDATHGGLTFVIVGGGPTGVEMAGAMAELFRHVLAKDFPRVDAARARVVLLEATDELLGTFHPRLRAHARRSLERLGVEVRLGATVTKVTASEVHLESGEVIPTRTLLWVAGVRASPLADSLGLEQDRAGKVVVGRDLRVPGRPEVFVVGDMAAARDRKGRLYSQVAPVAIQQGRHAGWQVRRLLAGKRTLRFRYFNRGTMATIGRADAVVQFPGDLLVTGLPGWLMWLGIHVLYLIGFRNRALVLLSWGWNYLTYDRGARLIVEGDEERDIA